MDILSNYEAWLKEKGVSQRTILFYKKDIEKALSWIRKTYEITNTFEPEMITAYERHLTTTKLSTISIKRMVSSLRSFSAFLKLNGDFHIKSGSRSHLLLPSFKSFTVSIFLFLAIILAGATIVYFYSNQPIKILTSFVELPNDIHTKSYTEGQLLKSRSLGITAEAPDTSEFIKIDSGRTYIPKGLLETEVYTQISSPHASIVVTPTNENFNLYIKSQKDGSFVVASNKKVDEDLYFNWIAINNYWHLDRLDP